MATIAIPKIKLLERVGKRVILSMSFDEYERIIEDAEMKNSREKLIERYEKSIQSGTGFSV